MEWTEVEVHEFIDAWLNLPCPYDITSDDYHNRVLKARAWDSLAQTFGTTGL